VCGNNRKITVDHDSSETSGKSSRNAACKRLINELHEEGVQEMLETRLSKSSDRRKRKHCINTLKMLKRCQKETQQ
jgi:hypothetical protein